MRRHVAEPLHAGGLERDTEIEPAGDGAVDDVLLLLVEERDQPALSTDGAADAGIGVLEEPDDGGLLLKRRNSELECSKSVFRYCRVGNTDGVGSDPIRECATLAQIANEFGLGASTWCENGETSRAYKFLRIAIDEVDRLKIRTDGRYNRVAIPDNTTCP